MTPNGGNDHLDSNGAGGVDDQDFLARLNGLTHQADMPASKGEAGGRREERVRMAVLAGLQQWRESGGSNDHAPTMQTDPDALIFRPPPGLLPPDVRRRLQGDSIPQVTPAMMRQLSWKVSVFATA